MIASAEMGKFGVKETIGLYERNYERMLRLVPNLSQLQQPLVINATDEYVTVLDVVEQSAYTSVVTLRSRMLSAQSWVEEPFMKIRVCHDARVAEVISSQGYGRIEARYTYPNPKMFGCFEKRQVNRFLGEWLDHCLAHGNRFLTPSHLTSV